MAGAVVLHCAGAVGIWTVAGAVVFRVFFLLCDIHVHSCTLFTN